MFIATRGYNLTSETQTLETLICCCKTSLESAIAVAYVSRKGFNRGAICNCFTKKNKTKKNKKNKKKTRVSFILGSVLTPKQLGDLTLIVMYHEPPPDFCKVFGSVRLLVKPRHSLQRLLFWHGVIINKQGKARKTFENH